MNVNRCLNAFVQELNASYAVISPGSRNAPLIYALDQMNIRNFSVVDERSAAFIALGIAKHTRKPVILSCTSGTAALNYYPAIAEAFYARVPLIILTADRPPEQIDAWDGQAIRQRNVFAKHVRASFDTPDDYNESNRFKAIAEKVNRYWNDNIPGPIHINIPIREPFYEFESLEARESSHVNEEDPIVSVTIPSIAAHLNQSFSDKKVLIFNGMDDGESVVVANGNDGVMLSDLTSNQTSDVFYWDAMLFSAQSKPDGLDKLRSLAPDVLITTGTTTISKGLKRFLNLCKPQRHYHLSSYNEVGNMFGTNPTIIDPKKISAVPEIDGDVDGLRDGPFVKHWLETCREFEDRFSRLEWTSYNEFSVVNYVVNNVAKDAIIHLSNSMPVRYASFLMNSGVANNLVYSNRGTSGIDGCTSTAIGNALVADKQVYLLTGDLAFFYDINAFFNKHVPANFKVVILNNSGGRIFEMISGPEKMGEAIQLQTTPHHFTAEQLSEHFKFKYIPVKNISDLADGMEELIYSDVCTVMEIFTDTDENADFFEKFKAL